MQSLILQGDLFRADGLYKTEYAFAVVAKDKTEFLFDYVSIGRSRHAAVRLCGLQGNAVYADGAGNRYTGAQLMQEGLPVRNGQAKYAYDVRHFTVIDDKITRRQ